MRGTTVIVEERRSDPPDPELLRRAVERWLLRELEEPPAPEEPFLPGAGDMVP